MIQKPKYSNDRVIAALYHEIQDLLDMPALFPTAMTIWYGQMFKDIGLRFRFVSIFLKPKRSPWQGVNFGIGRLTSIENGLRFSQEQAWGLRQQTPASTFAETLTLRAAKRSVVPRNVVQPLQIEEDGLAPLPAADQGQSLDLDALELDVGLDAIEPRALLTRPRDRTLTPSLFSTSTTSSNPGMSASSSLTAPSEISLPPTVEPGGAPLDAVEMSIEESYNREKIEQEKAFHI